MITILSLGLAQFVLSAFKRGVVLGKNGCHTKLRALALKFVYKCIGLDEKEASDVEDEPNQPEMLAQAEVAGQVAITVEGPPIQSSEAAGTQAGLPLKPELASQASTSTSAAQHAPVVSPRGSPPISFDEHRPATRSSGATLTSRRPGTAKIRSQKGPLNARVRVAVWICRLLCCASQRQLQVAFGLSQLDYIPCRCDCCPRPVSRGSRTAAARPRTASSGPVSKTTYGGNSDTDSDSEDNSLTSKQKEWKRKYQQRLKSGHSRTADFSEIDSTLMHFLRQDSETWVDTFTRTQNELNDKMLKVVEYAPALAQSDSHDTAASSEQIAKQLIALHLKFTPDEKKVATFQMETTSSLREAMVRHLAGPSGAHPLSTELTRILHSVASQLSVRRRGRYEDYQFLMEEQHWELVKTHELQVDPKYFQMIVAEHSKQRYDLITDWPATEIKDIEEIIYRNLVLSSVTKLSIAPMRSAMKVSQVAPESSSSDESDYSSVRSPPAKSNRTAAAGLNLSKFLDRKIPELEASSKPAAVVSRARSPRLQRASSFASFLISLQHQAPLPSEEPAAQPALAKSAVPGPSSHSVSEHRPPPPAPHEEAEEKQASSFESFLGNVRAFKQQTSPPISANINAEVDDRQASSLKPKVGSNPETSMNSKVVSNPATSNNGSNLMSDQATSLNSKIVSNPPNPLDSKVDFGVSEIVGNSSQSIASLRKARRTKLNSIDFASILSQSNHLNAKVSEQTPSAVADEPSSARLLLPAIPRSFDLANPIGKEEARDILAVMPRINALPESQPKQEPQRFASAISASNPNAGHAETPSLPSASAATAHAHSSSQVPNASQSTFKPSKRKQPNASLTATSDGFYAALKEALAATSSTLVAEAIPPPPPAAFPLQTAHKSGAVAVSSGAKNATSNMPAALPLETNSKSGKQTAASSILSASISSYAPTVPSDAPAVVSKSHVFLTAAVYPK